MFRLSGIAMQAVCALERRLWNLERAGVSAEASTAEPPPDVLLVIEEMLEGRASRYRGQTTAGSRLQMPGPRTGLPARAEVG